MKGPVQQMRTAGIASGVQGTSRNVRVLLAAVAVAMLSTCAQGGIITFQPDSLADLLGPTAEAATDVYISSVNANKVKADIYSQAYKNDAGDYVYLYQVNNTGSTANVAIGYLSIGPFLGAGDDTRYGYLTGATPTPTFLSGGQTPNDGEFYGPEPQVDFYFNASHRIGIGQHSVILYITSRLPPELVPWRVTGSLPSGYGLVVGPDVPEPGSLGLLLLGAGVMVLRRRLKSRRVAS